MENRKKLYPLKFRPICLDHPWGEEKIALADLGVEDSVVAEGWLEENSIGEIMETYLERVTGESVYGYYGRQFPVAVKFLKIKGSMPVHVHPDDETAGQRYDSLGGKEMWYVAEAGDDAVIYLGFNHDVSARELYDSCMDGTVKSIMNVIRPKKGDVLEIRPGMVHSAEGHLKILAVKEASELPFRLHDSYENDRESVGEHLAEAMDFIIYDAYSENQAVVRRAMNAEDTGIAVKLMESPEFDASLMNLKEAVHSVSEHETGYILYIGMEGEASVQVPVTAPDGKKGMEEYRLRKGDAMLIPAEVTDFFIVPTDRDTVLMEVIAGKRDETDGYINPDTEPFLEGEDYEGLEDEETEEKDQAEAAGIDGPQGRHNMKWS